MYFFGMCAHIFILTNDITREHRVDITCQYHVPDLVRRTFDLHSVSVVQKSFSVTQTFIITPLIFQTEFVYRILTQTSWRRFLLTTGVWFYILIEIALPIIRCLRHVFQIRNLSHHGLQQRLVNLSFFISRCKNCLFFIIVRV